jgi:subtilisin family serine protease
MRSSLAFLLAVILCLAAPAAASAADPLRSQQWGLDMIQADAAHATSTGSGVTVAVIDTGVFASHEDLAGRLVAGRDFVQTPNDDTPQDENGHGTHVTGIIAADAGNGKGIEGVAPSVHVMPIRVLDADGSGDADTVAKGIDYAVAHNVDVINLSLGGDAVSTIIGGDDKFTAAVQNATSHGIVVVAAAGNDTAPFCEQPTVTGPLLCVGAVDRSGMRTFYSSSGDIMAPGGSAIFGGSDEDILSTWNDGKYETLAGTSQAAPHVAGVAALLESLGLRGQAVVDRLKATATPGDPALCPMCGAGIVNAKAAVAGLGGSGGSGGNGGGNTGGGGGTTKKAGFSYAHTQKIKKVLKHGVKATCKPSKAGKCKVRVRAKGKLIASGSRSVGGAGKFTVTATITSAGRKMLKNAKSVNGTLIANVPGGGQRSGSLKLVR